MSRKILAPLALGIVALLFTGCAGGQESGATSPTPGEASSGYLSVADEASDAEGPVTIQLGFDAAEASGYDPQSAVNGQSWALFGLVYETLVTIGPEFDVQPGLASSWEQPDDTTYIFTIDASATFSNGRAVSVDDVVGSLERLLSGTSIWASQLTRVESVTALDDTWVEIALSEPYTPLLATLANNPASILPMAEIESGEIDVTTEMLGTGPFVLDGHRQDESWSFVRNESYRNVEDVKITELDIRIAGSDATRQAALRDGSIAMTTFSGVDALSLLANSGASMYAQQQTDFFYLGINSLKADSPLSDQNLRFAINAAVDREVLSDSLFSGEAAATGVTPANLPGACDASALPSAQIGDDEIQELVDSSDYDGETLELLIYNSEPVLAQIAQVIQQQLASFGVDVEIVTLDIGAYLERSSSAPADFDLALGYLAGYADAAMVTRFWHSESGASATFAEQHDDLDALIDQAATEPAGPVRDEVMTDLCTTVDDYSEWVTLVLRPVVYGINESVITMDLAANEGYGDILRHLPTASVMGTAE